MAWPEIKQLKDWLADGFRLCSCGMDERPKQCPQVPCEKQVKIPLTDTTVVLSEQEETASLNAVHISGIPLDGLVLKLDVCGIRFWKGKKLNKLCDYVILTEWKEQKYAIFIDLKSSLLKKPTSDNCLPILDVDDLKRIWQFNGGSLLFDYMAMGVAFHGGEQALTMYKKCFFELYDRIILPPNSTAQPTVPNNKAREGIQSLRHKRILTQHVSNSETLSMQALIDAWNALPPPSPSGSDRVVTVRA